MRNLLAATLLSFGLPGAAYTDVQLPETFDYMGPTVQTLTGSDGRTIAFVDTGPEDGQAVLFVGGTGTSAAVTRLTDFLRGMRESLNLRLVSVGRAGFGQSDPAENWTFDDYAADAAAVLDQLGIGEVSIVAISGGGPYSAAFAAQNPDRIRSIHLAAAGALLGNSQLCAAGEEKMQEIFDNYAAHPLQWWAFPEDSPTHAIPGFGTAAADDGARTFGIAGQKGSGNAEVAEFMRYCTLELADVSQVVAPVYIYQGGKDTQVTPEHADHWQSIYQNVAARRDYPDGGHDVQYRHWDQILIDLAGMGDKIIVCQGGAAQLLSEADAERAITNGATLGICAWQ
ncbi:alpha/beta fold hydrolase [Sedimentitalea sp. XS_ASV28]|uniref:alpha/beta fold hydrolase n=1 Tax=Sedimentitalea sp. XS_ASV28 TaxID=3241296 RepID=UPI0035197D5E